ncbi:MAG: lysine--tRNA ligase [Spirochaetales bacterium]|nr:lysine--tRNA ligase [Spirochaetales bacterium]
MSDLNDQATARREKLQKLMESGIEPYPHGYQITHDIASICDSFVSLFGTEVKIRTAGRIMRIARKGKISFIDILNNGASIQLVLSKAHMGEGYSLIPLLHLGDFIGVEAQAYRTETGQESLFTQSVEVLAKALRPLPVPKQKRNDDGSIEVFDPFSDTELRYRKRYIDILVNPESRTRFIWRARILTFIRSYLESHGFIEVQTPILQAQYGGAQARPFSTQYNALDMNVFLRISNELFLKQCIIGGLPRVFEIGKDFRNEGIDRTHSPEFTMIEFYQAFADYRDMMVHFEHIFAGAASAIHGSTVIDYCGTTIDLTPPWKRITFHEALKEHAGTDFDTMTEQEVRTWCRQEHIEVTENDTKGIMLLAIFAEKVEHRLIQPHIVHDYPRESTPLCKRHRVDGDLVEQFEPYINGWEMGNAYTELNDPQIQRTLLETQNDHGRGGADEDYPVDEGFLEAIEYGMPPTGGAGIGIDRMVMLLTGAQNIRDVILFPLMRPDNGTQAEKTAITK